MTRPRILVVDDEPFNVDFLEQELDDLGYDTVSACNGREALERLRAQAPDLVLLDIMMPVMDGFAVLEHIKADPATRDVPVVIISAVNDLASIVRGIRSGADDYLPKPFEPVLLQARIRSGLERKLRRDLEVEYLRQVECLTAAAEAVQASAYDEAAIAGVAARDDALGNLARVFRRMAREVVAREQRLRQQLRQLQLDIEEQRASAGDTMAAYMPMDRRFAAANGRELAEHAWGTALFADISGFTPLTESFARELGLQRGAEEITRQVNRVLGALIDCVHRYGGSVVAFGGDAITCWFDGDGDGALRAVASAFAMQQAMRDFADVSVPGGLSVSIGLKVAVACGRARRMLVGDPNDHLLDVLGGRTMDALAEAERHARRGEVVATNDVVAAVGDNLRVAQWRDGERIAVIDSLAAAVAPAPWPDLAQAIDDAQSQPFVPRAVREKVRAGQSAFLSELRPAASLFVRFRGIDYDDDADAPRKLDAFTRFVESVARRHDGALLQLVLGDKGSYFHLTFGAPVAHYDDATRALRAALELQCPRNEFGWIEGVAVGAASGPVRAGAYGSTVQRAYSVIGDKANLAARLMMEAPANTVLCDEALHAAAREHFAFDALPPIAVKGKSQPVGVYRPLGEIPRQDRHDDVDRTTLVDRLPPGEQLTLKTASVIGQVFAQAMLEDICPDAAERPNIGRHLDSLAALELIAPLPHDGERVYAFAAGARDAAYARMLFVQRRQLHREVAQWYERTYAADPAPHYAALARHWRAADEPTKAIHYFELAGERARGNGAYEEAQRYFSESLAIDRAASVLSSEFAAKL